MIIIGSGLVFTLFIIALCYYCIIFGGFLFLTVILFPFIFLVGTPIGLYLEYKDYKKGKTPSFSNSNYVFAFAEFCFGLWFLIEFTIPFLEEVF